MRHLLLLFTVVLSQISFPMVIASAGADHQKANPELLERMKLYEEEKLVKLGERVHVAANYDYSNYAYIEGDDGIIVVDTGWFPSQAKRSLADFREQVSDKPIVALIYTHLHIDHFGAAATIVSNGDIPVYGPEGWQAWVEESTDTLSPVLWRRVGMQMGFVLPRGLDGTVGNGVNKSPVVDGVPALTHPPTIDVGEQTLDLKISGVRFQLIHAEGDVPQNLFVWLPDEKVLFTGDTPMHAVFPAIETARFEAGRSPRNLVKSIEKVIDLEPEFLVNGHGRLLIGAEDVMDVAIANRDVTEFMVDQLDRYYLKGYSADQIIDEMKLPPNLASHPDLQPHYHRVEWMVKQMYVKRAGFVGDAMDYARLTDSEEAKRLLPLMGGPKKALKAAAKALKDNDPRWAAALATIVMNGAHGKRAEEAMALRQDAFTRIAQTTVSANERNYLLSLIREENGEVDFAKVFAQNNHRAMKTLSTEKILSIMKARFKAEEADNLEMQILVRVEDEEWMYQIRNNVLILKKPTAFAAPDGVIALNRNTLNEVGARLTSWEAAYQAGQIEVADDSPSVARLFGMLE
jgi:alkyl sulfatase BDS1-like metallo-beta-lactamase superfamily hydrolase